jgi:hypothetical protein
MKPVRQNLAQPFFYLTVARAAGARRVTSASTIMPINCSKVTDGVHPWRWRPFDASPIR